MNFISQLLGNQLAENVAHTYRSTMSKMP